MAFTVLGSTGQFRHFYTIFLSEKLQCIDKRQIKFIADPIDSVAVLAAAEAMIVVFLDMKTWCFFRSKRTAGYLASAPRYDVDLFSDQVR